MCTAIHYKNGGSYFGRTLDLEYHYREEVVVTPRHFSLAFRNGITWEDHYAIIGMATVAENYPQLHANTNFLDLQNQLKGIESELEASRRYYNGVVKSFNTKLELFPANIVGRRMGEDYTKRPYFELESAEERKNVKVQF